MCYWQDLSCDQSSLSQSPLLLTPENETLFPQIFRSFKFNNLEETVTIEELQSFDEIFMMSQSIFYISTSQSTAFQSHREGATASWTVLCGVNVSCMPNPQNKHTHTKHPSQQLFSYTGREPQLPGQYFVE